MNRSVRHLFYHLSSVAAVILMTAGCAEESPAQAVLPQKTAPDTTVRRIVSLIPSATSIIYEIGAGDRLVGVTRYCRKPFDKQEVPVVGGILDPSLEAVASVRPDLVIGSSGVLKGRLTEILGGAGVRFLPLDFETLEDVRNGIVRIADRIGLKDEGNAALEAFNSGLVSLDAGSPRIKVILVVGTKPLVVAGKLSFQGQLLDFMGFDNVVQSDRMLFPTWSLEQVIQASPDVIIDGISGGEPSAALLSEAGVKAKVAHMPDDRFLLPSLEAVKAAAKLRDAILDARRSR